MARAVGDSAVASLLCAMKEFSDDGGARSLDESFASYFSHISPAILPYEMLEAGVLEADIPPAKPLVPYSRLNVLEDLLTSFCQLNEWVFCLLETMKRPTRLFLSWLRTYKRHIMERRKSSITSLKYIGIVAWFVAWARLLTSICFSMDDGTGELVQSTRGQPIEAWASSCSEMEDICSAVSKRVTTGSFHYCCFIRLYF